MKKKIAFITALVLTALSVPAAVSAADFAQGDVDMDGIITGRDAAIVSQYADGVLKLDLTDKQLSLADMNGDGTADAADAGLIYEQQEYPLGDVTQDGYADSLDSSAVSKMCLALWVDSDIDPAETYGMQYLLADVDCNGVVDIYDAHCILEDYVEDGANTPVFEDGKYYTVISEDEEREYVENDITLSIMGYDVSTLIEYTECYWKLNGYFDVDSDEGLSVNDASMVLGIYAANAAEAELTDEQSGALEMADANGDGYVTIEDAALILTAYAKAGAGLL